VPSIAPRARITWVNDLVPSARDPASVRVRVGEAPSVRGAAPQMTVTGVQQLTEASGSYGASGNVTNRSTVAQVNLVVFGVAYRAGVIVAAGRAVLPELAAGASARFEMFFAGDPRGAQLVFGAPASTFD